AVGEEGDDRPQSVLDRAEVPAVAPALPDVHWRLAEAALRRIQLAQVRQVVHPAHLGAAPDVDVDALDGLVVADAVLAALQDVAHLLLLETALPALAVPPRLAPALALVRDRRAGVRLAPLEDVLLELLRAPGEVDDGVDGAGVVHLVCGHRRGVDGAGPRHREDLPLERVRRHARPEDLGDARLLVADSPGDVSPRGDRGR